MPVHVRPSEDRDLAAIQAIYAHHVLHGAGSFELDPPDLAEMDRRRREILVRGLPYLVAEQDSAVIGYAYAGPFRPRPAYRWTVEVSVYIDAAQARLGVGRALLSALLSACEVQGFRQALAIIGDSANAASIGLHQALGFRHAGLFQAIGFKHGRWLDSVQMQRSLGEGAATPPHSHSIVPGGLDVTS